MATRLNVELRNKIVENAVAKSEVPKLKDAYSTGLKKWIDDVWLLAIGGKKALAKLEKVAELEAKIKAEFPKAMHSGYRLLRREYMFRLNLGGMNLKLYFVGALEYDHNSSDAEHYRYSPSEFTVEGSHPLHQRFLDLAADKQAYEDAEATIRGNVRSAVNSVATVEKLVELWPEAIELLPAETAKPCTALAVQPAELNAIIGLPTPKKRTK